MLNNGFINTIGLVPYFWLSVKQFIGIVGFPTGGSVWDSLLTGLGCDIAPFEIISVPIILIAFSVLVVPTKFTKSRLTLQRFDKFFPLNIKL